MRRQPFNSMLEVLESVESGKVDVGFVPIENMIEGAVTSSIDSLAFGTGLLIQYEVIMDVRLTLMALPGTDLQDVKYVRSYPVAYAQCSRFLTRRLPGVRMVAADSTAGAPVIYPPGGLGHGGDRSEESRRCLRPGGAGGGHRGSARQQDTLPAGRPRHRSPPTGRDKTSLVVYQRADAPGSLVGILGEFVARSINITNLQSRPTKASLGSYCFLIDCEGHIVDERLGDALRNLQMRAASVKFLGSYPAGSVSHVDDPTNRAAPEDVDASYVDDDGYLLLAGVPDQTSRAEADAWLADVRSRVV